MNKQDLLQLLNADAESYGLKPISERQLNDWIDDGLVGKSQASGRKRGENPSWNLSVDSTNRARAIVASISFGASRKTEHQLFLWVSGFEFQFIDVRKSFSNEFRRFVRRQRRSTDWKYDHRDRQRPDKLEKHLRQIPPLDPVLGKLQFEIPKASLMGFISGAYFGKSPGGDVLPVIAQNFAEKFGISPQLVLEQLSVFSMEGLLGDQEEIDDSAVQLIKIANEADFQIGRLKTKAFIEKIKQLSILHNLADPDLDKYITVAKLAANSLQGPNWLISFLASGILAAFRARTKAHNG